MLRVRPIVFTPNVDAFSQVFSALGLTLTEDAPGWKVFAADSGAVALHAADEPSFTFGFEVGSADEFARRTVEAGTDAVVVDTPDGRAAQVTSADGRTFLAYQTPLKHAAPPSDGLAVMPIWHSPGVDAAGKVFRDIGAREGTSSLAGTRFAAKNGGLVLVRKGQESEELAFAFSGDPAVLERRVREASLPSSVEDVASPTLRIPSPDGGEVNVFLR